MMRSDIPRALATLFVWLMGGGIAITALFQGMFIGGGSVVFVVLITLVATMGSTSFIWKDGERERTLAASEKTKRRGRVDRFVEDLSDQERELLLTRLTESDGEVSLEEVLRRR
jgi:hypothetical protein